MQCTPHFTFASSGASMRKLSPERLNSKGAAVLKLRKVELQGFKSFCDRTELRFNGGGIAAVVGPNGCGKSNLSDAISWVLGEQSARSPARRPHGRRDLRRHQVPQAGRHGVGHHGAGRSADARRLRPRRRSCRQRMPTGEMPCSDNVHGTSIHHPARQTRRNHHHPPPLPLRRKRIPDRWPPGPPARHPGHLHGQRPRTGKLRHHRAGPHRPDPFLQAAGPPRRHRRSRRHHQVQSRRRLAEAKLESSKQNLARVFDILEEVTRQVNSLKRQAAKAKRYQELKGELEGQLRTVLAGRYVTLKAEAEKCRRRARSRHRRAERRHRPGRRSAMPSARRRRKSSTLSKRS